jgi:hypothetical protein
MSRPSELCFDGVNAGRVREPAAIVADGEVVAR